MRLPTAGELEALTLDEAKRRLAERGVEPRIVVTGPPDRALIGPERVLAVRRRGNDVILIVSRSGPLPPGV